MKGAEALVAVLENLGVDTIFGYPGGANLPIYDALYKSRKIAHVLARHEQGAALMADGYARVAGKSGVCLATSGPGATNIVTGLANAYLDSVPMLAITGQIPMNFVGTDAFQEVDCINITMHVTKHNELVSRPEEIVPATLAAHHLANSGRKGPVLLDFPKDVMSAEADFDLNRTRELPGYEPNVSGHVGQLKKMVRALLRSEKPLALVGGGVHTGNAERETVDFLRTFRIPAVRTLMGKGVLNEDDPLYVGMAGTHGSVEGNKAVREADLIIALGTRFADRTTLLKPKNFARQAKIVHIDIDPAEIGKNVAVDIPIVGDLRDVLGEVAPMLLAKGFTPKPRWHRSGNLKNILYTGDHAHVIEEVLKSMNRIDEELYVTTDVGRHQMWATHCSLNPKHLPFLTSGGLGTMGFGLPAAIGAWHYRRDRPVVNITGDGSFLMNLQEFTLAVERDIPLTVIVINDFKLGMIRELQNSTYGKRHIAHDFNRHTNFADLAKAFGGRGIQVKAMEEVFPALSEAIACGKPTIIDFDVETIASGSEAGKFPCRAA